MLVGMFVFSSYAQTTKEVEVSNAEKFSTSSGALIKKDYLEIGDIKGAKVQVVKFQDLISDKSTSAIKFEYEVKSSYSGYFGLTVPLFSE